MYAFMFWEVSSKKLAASSDSPTTSSTHVFRKKEGQVGCLVGSRAAAKRDPLLFSQQLVAAYLTRGEGWWASSVLRKTESVCRDCALALLLMIRQLRLVGLMTHRCPCFCHRLPGPVAFVSTCAKAASALAKATSTCPKPRPYAPKAASMCAKAASMCASMLAKAASSSRSVAELSFSYRCGSLKFEYRFDYRV